MATAKKRSTRSAARGRRKPVRRTARKRTKAKRSTAKPLRPRRRAARKPARGRARSATGPRTQASAPIAAPPEERPRPLRTRSLAIAAMASPQEGSLCAAGPRLAIAAVRTAPLRCRCGHTPIPGERHCYECGRGE